MKRVIVSFITILVFSPSISVGEELSACVRRSGVMYLIGPEYRRQECRPNDTPTTINTEGVQGEPGPQGPPGPQGVQGLQGPSGQNLRVFDGNGVEIGLLLGGHQNVSGLQESFSVFDVNFEAVGTFNFESGSSVGEPAHDVGYITTDCTGQAYADGLSNPYLFSRSQTGDFFVGDNGGVVITNLNILSRRNSSGTCNAAQNLVYSKARPVHHVVLPYTGPYTVVRE